MMRKLSKHQFDSLITIHPRMNYRIITGGGGWFFEIVPVFMPQSSFLHFISHRQRHQINSRPSAENYMDESSL
jgi:hypothetical protein